MLLELCRQAKEDPLGFKAAVYEFTQLGSFGGFRQQEFAMDSKNQIKYYVKPNGDLVVRAFTVSNFLFYVCNIRIGKFNNLKPACRWIYLLRRRHSVATYMTISQRTEPK